MANAWIYLCVHTEYTIVYGPCMGIYICVQTEHTIVYGPCMDIQYRLRISTHQIAFSRDIDLSASRCDVIRPRDRSREIAICGQRGVNKI